MQFKDKATETAWMACYQSVLSGLVAVRGSGGFGNPISSLGKAIVEEAALMADYSIEHFNERSPKKDGTQPPFVASV